MAWAALKLASLDYPFFNSFQAIGTWRRVLGPNLEKVSHPVTQGFPPLWPLAGYSFIGLASLINRGPLGPFFKGLGSRQGTQGGVFNGLPGVLIIWAPGFVPSGRDFREFSLFWVRCRVTFPPFLSPKGLARSQSLGAGFPLNLVGFRFFHWVVHRGTPFVPSKLIGWPGYF